jgi:hypothetical protein
MHSEDAFPCSRFHEQYGSFSGVKLFIGSTTNVELQSSRNKVYKLRLVPVRPHPIRPFPALRLHGGALVPGDKAYFDVKVYQLAGRGIVLQDFSKSVGKTKHGAGSL